MPSVVKGRSGFENRKKELKNLDFHNLTEKCGLKMKNLAVSNKQISQSRRCAAHSAAVMCAKLTQEAGRTGHGARRSRPQGGAQTANATPAKRMENADFAVCAQMEQRKWLADRSRPPPKQQFPFKEKVKRSEFVRHFRAAADRFADSVLRMRDSSMGLEKHGVPLRVLAEKEILRRASEATTSSGYGTGISSCAVRTENSLFPRISARNKQMKSKPVNKSKKENECDSMIDTPVFKDSTHLPQNPVTYYKKNSREMGTRENGIKVILPPKSFLNSPKSSQSSMQGLENNFGNSGLQSWQKRFQDICQEHEMFMKQCDRILPPSLSELSSRSQRSVLSQMEENPSNLAVSPKKSNELKGSLCLQQADTNPLFKNALSRQKMIPKYESKMLGSTNNKVSTYFNENSSRVSVLSVSPRGSSLAESNSSNQLSVDLKSIIAPRTQDSERFTTSNNTLRSQLAEDVFSWKSSRKQNKRFSAKDFRCDFEEDLSIPKPVLNLKFPSDLDKQKYKNTTGNNSIPLINLQKSTVNEIQIPKHEVLKDIHPIEETKVEEKIKDKDNSSRYITTVMENALQKFLKEKRIVHFDSTKIKAKNVKQNSAPTRDGVDVRLRRIPDATKKFTSRLSYRVPATNLTGVNNLSEFAPKPLPILNLNHRHALFRLSVNN